MHTTHSSAYRRRLPQHGPVAPPRPDAADWDTGPEWLSSTGMLPEQFFPFQTSRWARRSEATLVKAQRQLAA